MNMISITMGAVAPGLSLLAYFYLRDRYESEPIRLVLRLFVFGLLLVFPIMVVQHAISLHYSPSLWVKAFFQSAWIEECMKAFVLYVAIYRHEEFDEPYDGIVYAAAVSMGFATFENMVYLLSAQSPDWTVFIGRSLLPVTGHALFAVSMGYFMGKARFENDPVRRMVWMGLSLGLPIVAHGLFNYVLSLLTTSWMIGIVPLMVLLWMLAIWKVRSAHERSPFRHKRVYEQRGDG